MLDDICALLENLLTRLSRAEAALLLDGLRALCETMDPSMLLQESTRIEEWGYYRHPRPRFPGFFKPCRGGETSLPEPIAEAGVDALRAIRERRSRREYRWEPLTPEELSTILYHAVGIRGYELGWPLRVYPSAGGLQPVEVYVNALLVEGVEPGLYHYNPRGHTLCKLRGPIPPERLQHLALDQEHAAAPATLILTAVYARTASKYGARGYRYAHLDTGAVMQNVYLAAEALGLATVAIGAFYDHELCRELGIDCRWEIPMLIMPLGRPATRE